MLLGRTHAEGQAGIEGELAQLVIATGPLTDYVVVAEERDQEEDAAELTEEYVPAASIVRHEVLLVYGKRHFNCLLVLVLDDSAFLLCCSGLLCSLEVQGLDALLSSDLKRRRCL